MTGGDIDVLQLYKRWCYVMEFIVNPNSKETIYEQIAFQIKLAITNGELKIGDSIPSVRSLSKSLSVSTLSVQRAYTELQKDGIIESTEGKGNYVSSNLNKSTLKDALIKAVEGEALRIISVAKQNGIELSELNELITILWEEN
jgi:GntR family transcriptional regulator